MSFCQPNCIFEAIGKTIFDRINPFIIRIRKFIESLKELSPETKGLILTVASIAAALGPLIFGLGTLITTLGFAAIGFAAFSDSIIFKAIKSIFRFTLSIFTKGIPALLKFTLSIFTKAIPAIAKFAASLVTTAVRGLLTFAASLITTVIPAVFAFTAALLTNPVFLIIAAIAGAALLIVKFWEPIKAFWADLWESISAGAMVAFDFLKSILSDVVGFYVNRFKDLFAIGKKVAGFFGIGGGGIEEGAQTPGGAVGGVRSPTATTAGNTLIRSVNNNESNVMINLVNEASGQLVVKGVQSDGAKTNVDVMTGAMTPIGI